MSKRIRLESGFFENIAAGLERELGTAYQVVREPRFERWLDLREPADLAVIDRETGHATLIEIKTGIVEDDDVPIATIAEMLDLQETNAHLQPRAVLVSTMRVGAMVEQWLSNHGVGVIRGRTSGEIVPQLAEFIAAGSVAAR